MRILDLGCGSGVLTTYLAKRAAHALGLDLSPKAVAFAHQNRGSDGEGYVCGSALQLPFHDAKFDAVYCFEVLEHLYVSQASAMLSEIHRVLRSGGHVVVTTPDYGSLWPMVEKILDALRLVPRLDAAQHVQRFTRPGLLQFAHGSGFSLDTLGRGFGIAPFTSILGWWLAERIDNLEQRLGQPLGMLLVGVWSRE